MRLSEASEILGVSKKVLKRWIDELGIDPQYYGLQRFSTQPISFSEEAFLILFYRFLGSEIKVPFAIKVKICYNLNRWFKKRRKRELPATVKLLASFFDVYTQRYTLYARNGRRTDAKGYKKIYEVKETLVNGEESDTSVSSSLLFRSRKIP